MRTNYDHILSRVQRLKQSAFKTELYTSFPDQVENKAVTQQIALQQIEPEELGTQTDIAVNLSVLTRREQKIYNKQAFVLPDNTPNFGKEPVAIPSENTDHKKFAFKLKPNSKFMKSFLSVALLSLVFTIFTYYKSTAWPQAAVTVPSMVPYVAPSDSSEPAGHNVKEKIIVYLTGAVHKPGVVELEVADRLYKAIEKCGGATKKANLAAVNLARLIQDGEHIHIPMQGESTLAEESGAGETKLNINTATQAQLETLPGIGPAIAKRIVAHRQKNGKFKKVEEITQVPGVGTKIVTDISELVVAK